MLTIIDTLKNKTNQKCGCYGLNCKGSTSPTELALLLVHINWKKNAQKLKKITMSILVRIYVLDYSHTPYQSCLLPHLLLVPLK